MTSWMSRHCALGVILIGLPLLGRFTIVLCFQFVDNGSDRDSLESQSLRNGFITLSRLIQVKYLVFHLFLNFYRLRHDVLLFTLNDVALYIHKDRIFPLFFYVNACLMDVHVHYACVSCLFQRCIFKMACQVKII